MIHSAMRLKPSPVVLNILLRECYTRPHRHCLLQTRSYVDYHRTHKVKDVAILGGGITGLAAAYFLSLQQDFTVTLYEGSSRLGGWLRSTSIDVGTGNVVFEQGPRTLRPSLPGALRTLHLIKLLKLEDEVLMTSKNSVAAQNRFVYYPDHLVRMPGPGQSLFSNLRTVYSEPVFNGFLSGALTEPFRSSSQDLHDESVGNFISRRFGANVADNLVSAVFHGIYAGDIYQLSARSILSRLYRISQSYDSLVLGLVTEMIREDPLTTVNDAIEETLLKQSSFPVYGRPWPAGDIFFDRIKKSSVFTFKRGIGQLSEALEEALNENPRVTVYKNAPIESLELVTDGNDAEIQLKPKGIQFGPDEPAHRHAFSHVISTISGKTLDAIAQPAGCLSSLALTPSVTVMVVNLYYSNSGLLPVHGFGYLLPRSLPFEHNPERALGVVFDSYATFGQDNIAGTKLTVMFGGHWWDGWSTYPDEDEGAYMARAILARHLGIVEEPQAVRVALQKDCIPQYTVGHAKRMEQAHMALLKHFDGRLKVAGNSYTGVGLNDCVSAADRVGVLLKRAACTGLEDFAPGRDIWRRSSLAKT